MKEPNLEDSLDSSPELYEMPNDLSAESEEEEAPEQSTASNLTELRRRIEERLDSKRIALEYEWDDFDDLPESVQ